MAAARGAGSNCPWLQSLRGLGTPNASISEDLIK